MPLRKRCSLYNVMSWCVSGMPVGGVEALSEHNSVDTFNSGQRRYIEPDCSTVISALANSGDTVLQHFKDTDGDPFMGNWEMEQNPECHKLLCKELQGAHKVQHVYEMEKWVYDHPSVIRSLCVGSQPVCANNKDPFNNGGEKYNLIVKNAKSWSNYANRILLLSLFISFIISNVSRSPVGRVVLMRQALTLTGRRGKKTYWNRERKRKWAEISVDNGTEGHQALAVHLLSRLFFSALLHHFNHKQTVIGLRLPAQSVRF